MILLIDDTYELFRYLYGHRSYNKGRDKPFGAVVGHATLRTDAPLLTDVGQLEWHGPTTDFKKLTAKMGDPCLFTRAIAVTEKLRSL